MTIIEPNSPQQPQGADTPPRILVTARLKDADLRLERDESLSRPVVEISSNPESFRVEVSETRVRVEQLTTMPMRWSGGIVNVRVDTGGRTEATVVVRVPSVPELTGRRRTASLPCCWSWGRRRGFLLTSHDWDLRAQGPG